MMSIAKCLQASYSSEKLHILLAKHNSGSLTYDGIDLGGEMISSEIEQELKNIKDKGGKIKRLSMVGYSLGGLVSRYAIGLLYSKGILRELECMVRLLTWLLWGPCHANRAPYRISQRSQRRTWVRESPKMAGMAASGMRSGRGHLRFRGASCF